jgi:hypothetical protein
MTDVNHNQTMLNECAHVFPAASDAMHVVTVIPSSNREPEAGLQVSAVTPTLSVAFTSKKMSADVMLICGELTMSAGHSIMGGMLSAITTLNRHVEDNMPEEENGYDIEAKGLMLMQTIVKCGAGDKRG